jgi:hypothetical protein
MVEHTRASIAFLIIPLLGGPALAAQRQAYQYPVKYVCGNRLSSRSGRRCRRLRDARLPLPDVRFQLLAALVGTVDPKNVIAECREDNNSRTLGAVP